MGCAGDFNAHCNCFVAVHQRRLGDIHMSSESHMSERQRFEEMMGPKTKFHKLWNNSKYDQLLQMLRDKEEMEGTTETMRKEILVCSFGTFCSHELLMNHLDRKRNSVRVSKPTMLLITQVIDLFKIQ